jgi:hypothetical protein
MTSQLAPGCGVPWPDPRRYPVTRRLLALWRWEWERGPDSDAATNARQSLVNRTAGIIEEDTWRAP